MLAAWLALTGVLISPALHRLATRHGARAPLWVAVPVTGAVFALLPWSPQTPWRLAAGAWVAALGVCLALVDAAAHRLPDALTLPAFAGAAALLALDGALLPALLGAAALAGAYLVLALVHPAGMGLGDVKLALALGAVLGPGGAEAVALGGAAGLALAGLYAAGLLLLRRATPGTHLPHGPFMLLGALAAVLLPNGAADPAQMAAERAAQVVSAPGQALAEPPFVRDCGTSSATAQPRYGRSSHSQRLPRPTPAGPRSSMGLSLPAWSPGRWRL